MRIAFTSLAGRFSANQDGTDGPWRVELEIDTADADLVGELVDQAFLMLMKGRLPTAAES